MPRPKRHSDAQVLDRARVVLLAKGPDGFTLTDVAAAVGLSRAALIQRFTDKETLHLRVMERMTAEVRDYFAAASEEVGLAPLWVMLKDLIAGMDSGEDIAGHLLISWGDTRDAALNALAHERNALVAGAIAARLPPRPHPPAATASLIQAVIQGACLQWLVAREGSISGFMIDQTRRILGVLYPRHRFD